MSFKSSAKEAALAIRDCLMAGGDMGMIAKELGKMSILNPDPLLYDNLFNAQEGIIMEQHFKQGIIEIERIKLEIHH